MKKDFYSKQFLNSVSSLYDTLRSFAKRQVRLLSALCVLFFILSFSTNASALPAGAGNKVILTITGNISKSFTGKIENTARALSSGGTTEVSSNLVSTTVDNADFIIPNVITPNGDGSNDTFKIKGLENYPGTQVTIFNRWGNEVYRSGNYTNDWDGSQLNEGTYYYLILRKEKTGSTTTFKGWMFIKR